MTGAGMILTPTGLLFQGRRIPVSVGRGGVRADKREGDGATPVGRHKIVGALFRPDRIAQPAPWALPILPGDLWCDAQDDPAYNHLVRGPFAPSHETLRRSDPLYDIVLLTDWNWPDAVAGAGSAIFLHQWRRPGFPTAGCIAMARADLVWLTASAPPGTTLTIPAALSGRMARRSVASQV